MRKFEFNAWIPELGYMLEDVAIGHGSIGFPSDDEDFANALKAKGFDPEECNLPTWLYDTGEDWYKITEPNQFELLQHTGLKDKNAKSIFEGDIIISHPNKALPVSFENGCFMWQSEPLAFEIQVEYDVDGAQASLEIADTEKWAEVVGNIYQNPELIKK